MVNYRRAGHKYDIQYFASLNSHCLQYMTQSVKPDTMAHTRIFSIKHYNNLVQNVFHKNTHSVITKTITWPW